MPAPPANRLVVGVGGVRTLIRAGNRTSTQQASINHKGRQRRSAWPSSCGSSVRRSLAPKGIRTLTF